MSEEICRKAGRGLSIVFYGQLLAVLSLIPVAGLFLGLIGLILQLCGLFTGGMAHPGFRRAFTLGLVNLSVGVAGAGYPAVTVITMVLTLLQVRLICMTAAEFMRDLGETALAAGGKRTVSIFAVCSLAGIAGQLLILTRLPDTALDVIAFAASLILAVGNIAYLVYLHGTKEVLKNC